MQRDERRWTTEDAGAPLGRSPSLGRPRRAQPKASTPGRAARRFARGISIGASALALIGSALAAGCGDDDDDSSGCRGANCSPDGGASGASTGGRGGASGGTPSTGGAPSAGATGEGGAGGDGPEPCDPAGSPSDAACLVDEAFAVFVTPDGDDDAGGTREEPVATIAHAIALAADEQKIVIACAGTFDERIALADGVRLYGGFACPEDAGAAEAWSYEPGSKTVVAPSERGPALEVRDVAPAIVIEDFELAAQDASDPGESSVAALVARSDDVTLRRVRLVAGDGMPGADGTRVDRGYPNVASLRGNDGTALAGGASFACSACTEVVTSRPGAGGEAPNEDGGEGQPAYGGDGESPGPHDGEGGHANAACTALGGGLPGAQGFFGTVGAGATSFGTLTDDAGWTPAAGTSGGPGFPGQGGGGGAGKPGGGGGSGGCGGCGGVAGGAGLGGGASIGILTIGSGVTIEESEILTGAAGDGGAGSAGQPGQPTAGAGGLGFGTGVDRGCDGSDGGPGGAGGPGGGGAGGVSVGVLAGGDAPAIDDGTVITPGQAGLRGESSDPRGLAGIDGVASATLAVTIE